MRQVNRQGTTCGHDYALCKGRRAGLGCQMDFDHPEVTAKAGIGAPRRFFILIGMPKSFAKLGAKEEDIPKLVSRKRSTAPSGLL